MNCFIAIRNCAYLYAIIGAIAFLLCGCESIDNLIKPDDTTLPATASTELPNNITWLGASYGNSQPDGSLIHSASIDNKLHLDYTIPRDKWAITTMGCEVEAILCFFREENGKLIGGKMEWIRKGGQSVKELHNLHNGYNGHVMPLHGTPSHIMLVSVDGKYRTNMIQLEWQ